MRFGFSLAEESERPVSETIGLETEDLKNPKNQDPDPRPSEELKKIKK